MGFKKIFIGTILILLDFRIQGLNIIPDIIGYILIFIGLSEIIHLNSKFAVARIMSIILILFSIPDIYSINTESPSGLFYFINIITSIIYLIYSYSLYIGIKENAEGINNEDLANKAQLSCILAVVSCLSGIIVLINPFFMIPLLILVIVTLVIQLLTLSMAKDLE
ncbi:hypothetical protein KHQ81_10550 [Mycoplasmatota bacterium]|nr:hypothetical protein KHQ81_10550 [Mycoplasmatota bacterium]